MSRRLRQGLFAYALLAILAGCLEPYQPPEVKDDVDIMVVDGFINATDNSATVRLTYATALSSEMPPGVELNASVIIEESDGNNYTLLGDGEGTYSVDNIAVDMTKQYRLHIYTTGDKEYTSDYITITETPPIDSVTWKPESDGITLLVNSHDPENKAQYYRWNYVETWEYVASFSSSYKMIDGEAFERAQDDRIYLCWTEESSTEIIIGSSVRLSEDIIRDLPVAFVPGNSIKLSRRYSIFVEQRTLTKEAYDFWFQLQKTTESLGGLFDPMPSQVLGNIKNSPDGPEPVLGYFSGGHVSQKRIFIQFQDLPDELLRLRENAPCTQEDIKSIPVADIPSTPNTIYLIDPIYVSGVGIVAYTTAIPRCVDCLLQGGSTKRPDYW